MISPNLPSYHANLVTPFLPGGQRPVGLETAENRNSTLKPVEQLAKTAHAQVQLEKDAAEGRQQSANGRRAHGDQTAGEPDTAQETVVEREAAIEKRLEKARQAEQRQSEQQEIKQLAGRDREVRAHEQAHVAVGGAYAGNARYQFERGPNGISYAVSGEVSIDTSAAATPELTIQKAQQVRRAALAPAEPSPQDVRVAALAQQMEIQATVELATERKRQEQEVEQEREQESAQAKTEAKGTDAVAPLTDQSKAGVEPIAESGVTDYRDSVSRHSEHHALSSRLSQRFSAGGVSIPHHPGRFIDQHA